MSPRYAAGPAPRCVPRTFAEAVDALAHRSGPPLAVQAERIGRDPNYLRKACSQFDDAHPYRGDLIVPQTLASGDCPDTRHYVVLEYLARVLGGTFVRPVRRPAPTDTQLARVFREFAEFVTAVVEGRADARYDDDEVHRIAQEWHDVVAVGTQLVLDVQRQRDQGEAPA